MQDSPEFRCNCVFTTIPMFSFNVFKHKNSLKRSHFQSFEHNQSTAMRELEGFSESVSSNIFKHGGNVYKEGEHFE
jgi:hypothetical protein